MPAKKKRTIKQRMTSAKKKASKTGVLPGSKEFAAEMGVTVKTGQAKKKKSRMKRK